MATKLGALLKTGLLLAPMMVAGAAANAETVKLTIASSHPKVVAWVGVMSEHVVPESNKRLKEAGLDLQIEWTEAYGGALYKFQNTLEAVEEGITDVGWVGTLWEDSKMPLQNVTFHTPFVTDDLPTLLDLFNDMHRDMPALRKAWADRNQVFLGASGIETYHLLTKEPVEKFDDLAGRKIIAAGAVGGWVNGTGAVPVNGGLPGFYNMLKTGVAEGVLIPFSGAFPFKLYEVAPHITKVSLGAQFTGGMAMNKDSWDRLPPEAQQIFMDLGRDYSRIQAERLMKLASVFEKKMVDAGATVTELPAAERAKWVARLPSIADDWVGNVGARGLPAAEVLKTYMDGVRQRGAKPAVDWDR